MTEELIETVHKTKTELLSEMRELQQSYSKLASLLKEMTAAEEHRQTVARQMERLEQYKAKYTLYVNDDGSTREIDWVEVEKLITLSLENPTAPTGYALGFDQTGMEGLGYDYGSGGTFQPMVEEEADARKYMEREARRKEFVERAKRGK